MREKHVLSACIKDRAAFLSVANHVERGDFSEQGWQIWQGICDYYDADTGCKSVDTGILTDYITRKVAADKHKTMFRNLIGAISEFEVSVRNVVTDLLDTKREVKGQQLASAILAGQDTGKLLYEYNELLAASDFGEDEEEEARVGYSVEELVGTGFNKGSMIEVYPRALNDRLDGGVKPGHHLLVYARPEMGKTMLVIEMMAGFAGQDLKCLYIGNEDPLDDINMRIVNRLSGMSKMEVIQSPKKADVEARKSGYENLILKGLAPGTPREITALIEKHKPHVLVLDQLRNINMNQDNRVLSLEMAATQARQWAKRYSCVVVSVTQAGDSATNKAVLEMGDVDFSNTGIPAQCDVMIGVGANKNQQEAGEIVINLPKNKVSGRHEYFPCAIDPQLSRVVSIA